MFVIAACNPHRANSLEVLTSNADFITKTSDEQPSNCNETWIADSYYVHQLHPTLSQILWDYGSLNEDQERQYIQAKIAMLDAELSKVEISTLTEMIVQSQALMRSYTLEQLKATKMVEKEAKVRSRCCVSQRDIQRVFVFYKWLTTFYEKVNPHSDKDNYSHSRRALLVALGIVYFMRLNTHYRKQYSSNLDKRTTFLQEPNFSQAFTGELDWFINRIELPAGIAKTQALKENLFAVILCTMNNIPLIIVGAPGSSKTLSFNLAIANLKGMESKVDLFRDTELFPSLDPHFYQCSRRTTSNEIDTVFSRAIKRQKTHTNFSQPIKCVVFMDEAGLPERSHESLKILHHYLDQKEVSFVAISNTVLDAAKMNRAITLYRDHSEMSNDLEVLAAECLHEKSGTGSNSVNENVETVVYSHHAYQYLMKEDRFAKFFGLRDFIHFVNYIRRQSAKSPDLASPEVLAQLVTRALERNFNGTREFPQICKVFLDKVGSSNWHRLSSFDTMAENISVSDRFSVGCIITRRSSLYTNLSSENKYIGRAFLH